MRYLTYEEYSNIGGSLEKAVFDRVINRACGVIDYYTHKRVRNITADATQIGDELYIFGSSQGTVVEQVQTCIRDLCECLGRSSTVNGLLASRTQSAGGVSESESYVVRTSDETNAEMRDIVFDYLASETDVDGVPLLYRGCRS